MTAQQCMNYMKNGPPPSRPGQQCLAEGSERRKQIPPCPDLREELKCPIPRKYTEKKGALMATCPQAQTSIRNFMIEFNRALELERTGEYVFVFMNESDINANHRRLKSRAAGLGVDSFSAGLPQHPRH